jgi:hypothetical protein
MGNVIPWSQIHPSIKSQEPFLAVVMVDPHRQICVSELVDVDPEDLNEPESSAGALVAAAQPAVARVASGYRGRRRGETRSQPPAGHSGLRLLQGGLAKRR